MVGKLVRLKKGSISAPKGTLGLVLKAEKAPVWKDQQPSIHTKEWKEEADLPPPTIYTVQLCRPLKWSKNRRYLARDLEVVEV